TGRYLAKELGPRGIAVNAVAPGAIATDFSGGMVRAEIDRAARPDDKVPTSDSGRRWCLLTCPSYAGPWRTGDPQSVDAHHQARDFSSNYRIGLYQDGDLLSHRVEGG